MTPVTPQDTDASPTLPPPVPHEHPRPYLVHTLNNATRLLILNAPSGTGKTTLLAQWARQWHAGTPLWLTLRHDHQDPTVFIHDLLSTTRHAALPHVDHLPPNANRHELWLAWLHDLSTLTQPLALILDQAEHLTPPSAELLQQALHTLPPHHRLLLAHPPTTTLPLDTAERTVLTAHNLQHNPLPDEPDLHHRLTVLPHTWRDALTDLSVLDTWTDDSAAALGLTLPFTWADLLHTDLPLTPIDRGVTPHDTLLRQLHPPSPHPTPQRATLHARAGAWAERRGQPYTAITHYLDARQPDHAARVAGGLSELWERHADWLLCRTTLERIGEPHLTPAQRALLALALTETADPERGEALAHRVNSETPSTTAYLALALQAYRRGDRDVFGAHITAGEHAAQRQQDLVQMGRMRAIWYQLGHDLERATEEAHTAVRRAQAISETSLHLSALGVLSFLLLRQGRTDEALSIDEQILDASRALGYLHRLMPTIERLTKLYLDRGRIHDAERMLTPYTELYRRQYPLGLPVILGALAEVQLARHDPGAATAYLREAYRLASDLKDPQDILKHGSALIVVLTLQHGAAHLDEARAVLAASEITSDVTVNQRLIATAQAYILAAQGDWAHALSTAEHAQAHLNAQGEAPDYLLTLVEARAALALGQLTPTHLQRLQDAAVPYPSDQHYLRINPEWHRLLQGAQTGTLHPAAPPAARPTLHAVTLGAVQLTFGDQPLALPSTPTVELLLALLVRGHARQDDLALDVWPGRDIKRARASAQVARSTINAASGIPLILTEGRGRPNPKWRLNPDVDVQLDLQELLQTRDPHRVRKLYRGAFLVGHDAPWVTPIREAINAHLREVYSATMHVSSPAEALRWACELAVITQSADDFEAVRNLARVHGHQDLMLQAEQALLVLAQGETVTLRHIWGP